MAVHGEGEDDGGGGGCGAWRGCMLMVMAHGCGGGAW